jgi:hypothetical protein
MMNFEVPSQSLEFNIGYSTFDISEIAGKRYTPAYRTYFTKASPSGVRLQAKY